MRKPFSLFYGWYMVGAGLAIQLMIGAFMFQAYGAYVEALRDQYGWSKTLFSAGFAMSRVESGLLGPVQGWAVDRFGPRILAHIGLGMMGFGFLAFSQINSPVTFLLAFFVIAVGSSIGGFPTLMVAVINWFDRRRSLAISLVSSGLALGGIFVYLVIVSIDELGWRTTAFASGVIILVAGQLLASILRHRPEDYGWEMDGYTAPEEDEDADGEPASRTERTVQLDYGVHEALRTPAFWFISLGHGSAVLVVGAVLVHLVVHISEDLGYSARMAGGAIAVVTAFQIIGQIAGGILGDRMNKQFLSVACMAGHVVALLMLAYATALWMVFVFAVVHGTAWGMRAPLMQALRADYFGRTSYGTINGFSSMIVMAGMTLGPLIPGIIADQTGTYTVGFTVLAIMAGIGSVFFILARPPGPPKHPANAPSA